MFLHGNKVRVSIELLSVEQYGVIAAKPTMTCGNHSWLTRNHRDTVAYPALEGPLDP